MVGRSLGPYQVLELIGAGGMATVYKAFDPRMSRHVALKVLPPQFATNDALRARLLQETRIAANLEHFHILRVYDCGEYESVPYIVMRLLEPGSLSERLKPGVPMPTADIIRLVRQIAAALNYAHARGVVHRDLKPANVLLDENDNAYLTDFGLAQLAEDSMNLTGSAYIGTPTYSSPEQCLGKEITAASDIYSLGIMLFHMLTGKLPFTGSTALSVLNKHVREPMPDPRRINPRLPAPVAEVVRRATVKSPKSRFRTAGQLANALIQALNTAPPAPAVTRPLSPKRLANDDQTVVDENNPPLSTPVSDDAEAGKAVGPTIIPSVMLLTGHKGDVTATGWSLGGARLASASNDSTIRVWDASSGRELMVLTGHSKWVNAVVWSPRGTHLASASMDRTIKIWQAVTGESLVVLEGHTGSVWSVDWHRSGQHLASAGLDGTIRIWRLMPGTRENAPGGRQLAVLNGHMGTVRAVKWSPNGRFLASGGNDGTVRIWQITMKTGLLRGGTSYRMMALSGHGGWVRAVSWSPDGQLVASGSDDDTVRVWRINYDEAGNFTSGEAVAEIRGHSGGVNAVAWSPQSASSERGTGLLRYTTSLDSDSFGPLILASGSGDRTARIWDVKSGEALAVMQGHKGWVWSVAWSPKAELLSTGSADGTVRVWKPTPLSD